MSNDEAEQSTDPRPPALGVARLLFGAFLIFALYALYNEVRQLLVTQTIWYPAHVASLLALALWFLGTAGLIHNGRRMRMVAWAAFLLESLAVIVTTILGLFDVRIATSVTMLGMAGAYYYYIPLVGSVAALGWLVWSNPRRLAGH